MIRSARNLGVVANFWEWYQRRQQQECNPLAGYALDKCEEAFMRLHESEGHSP
jgi:hypothetical protein